MNNTNLNEASLDQINALKLECQSLMPLVELLKIKADPNSFMGLQRDQKLSIMGFSPEQIQEMTGYKQKDPVPYDPDAVVELIILDKDLPDEARELNARLDAEWRAEFDRMLEQGIVLGFIEEEMNCGSNL